MLTYLQMTLDCTWAAASLPVSRLEKPSDQNPKIKFPGRNKSEEEKQIVSLPGREELGVSVLYTSGSRTARVLPWVSLVAYSSEEQGWPRGTLMALQSCVAYASVTDIKIEISGEIS